MFYTIVYVKGNTFSHPDFLNAVQNDKAYYCGRKKKTFHILLLMFNPAVRKITLEKKKKPYLLQNTSFSRSTKNEGIRWVSEARKKQIF